MPYDISHNTIKGRKSLVVIKVGDQYEIIGRLLPEHRVHREFDVEDPLITRINTFLYNKNLIPSLYPNLVPYLKSKKKASSSSSDSESSESESDCTTTQPE